MPSSLRAALAIAGLLLAPVAGQAQLQDLLQGNVPPANGARDTAAAVRPIPLTQVGTEAETVLQRLGGIEQLVAPDPAIATIERRIAAERDTLEALAARTAGVTTPPIDRRDVMDVIQDWRRAEATVERQLETLRRRLGDLGEAKASLEEWTRRWTVTDSAAAAAGAGPELRSRIAQVRDRIARTDAALTERLDAVVSVESEHAAALYRTRSAILSLRDALDTVRRQAFARDAAPLWAMSPDPEGVAQLETRARREVGRVLAAVQRNPFRLTLHLLGTAFLVWLLTRASRAVSRSEEGDRGAAAAGRILGQPVAAALLVGFMLTLWIYPNAPVGVYDLALVLATVPIIVLTPSILAESLAGPVVGLAVVHLLARLDSAFLGEGMVHRLALLGVGLGGSAVLALALRRRALRQAVTSPRWGMALRRTGQVALGLMLVGVVGNLLGFLTLAEFMAESVPLVLTLAVVLAGFVRVLDGLFVMLLDGWGRRYLRSVQKHRAVPRRAGWLLLQVVGVLTWIASALWAFSLWEPTQALVRRVLEAGITVGQLRISVGGILVFLLVVWLAAMIAKMLGGLIEEDILGRMELDRGVAPTVARLIRYALVAVGVIVALAAAGVELTSLAIVGGALGVGIGFGLQGVVANFVAGLILAFERPIKIGDLVEVEGLTGTVRRIGIRASVVHTLDGSEVIVPNSDLVSRKVVNWTFTDPMRRIEIPVGVAYGTDAGRVLALLRGVADAHPDVLKAPEPQALFKGFGDSSLDFALRTWTERFDQWFVVQSDLVTGIHDALNAEGIVIPFPQRDLHLKSITDGAGRLLHAAPDAPEGEPEA